MQNKRPRIPSLGESDAATGGTLKRLSTELPQPRIFTIPSNAVVERFSHGIGATFIEKCHLCKKCISAGCDVFMYGNTRGFCSPEYRDEQIKIEKFDKPDGISAADFSK